MHSFSRPWIFGTRSRSANDWKRFFADISKFSRRCVEIVRIVGDPRPRHRHLVLNHSLIKRHDHHVVEVEPLAGVVQDAHDVGEVVQLVLARRTRRADRTIRRPSTPGAM